MRFLLFTTLYPNAEMPTHGVFVENRLRAFLKKYHAEVKVVAPVPWFPFHNETFGPYAKWARVPDRETRHGVDILHPRYFTPPKIGMSYAPRALARCLRGAIGDLVIEGWDFDFIDAHYFYPDGVAASLVATEIGKPVVITARGSDINLIPNFTRPRKAITAAAMKADAIICVAEALKTELKSLGVPAQKITTLRNGVDLDCFKPQGRVKIREAMTLAGPVIASVGLLIKRKGHDRVIEALRDIPDATLLIAGDGPERAALEALAATTGLADRTRFLGAVPHEELGEIYNAADVLALASSREGWPNVLLEAMACGTPCVAAPVWGCGEVIGAPEAGLVATGRSADAIAAAIKMILSAPPGRDATRRYAEHFSWDETTEGMAAVFNRLRDKARAIQAIKTSPIKPLSASYKPRLIITVDTEEQFDWSAFDSNEHFVNDPSDIARFQDVCAAEGVKPLYFITYPLLKAPKTADYFRTLRAANAADCGLHLHQWVTPAANFDDQFQGEYFSFQKNLPQTVHREKLKTLASAFEAVFGTRAISHRAGRYGAGPADYALLADMGIRHDFSPSAGFDFSCAGGPDFSTMSNHPFRASLGDDTHIHITPVCGARAIKRTRIFLGQENSAPGFAPPRSSPLARALAPLTIAMRLSPEGACLDDLKSLTRRLAADKTPVLTFTLHSTSLTPGANDYTKDADGVAHILDLTREYILWFRNEMGGDIISLGDLDMLYKNNAGADI